MSASCIYTGVVMHRRTRPRAHRLGYEVASFLLDLDELPQLDRSVSGFAYNRFGLFAFHDRDHGPGTGAPLRPWIEGHLASAGIDLAGGPIRLLCYPRVLGYVFNPLSVYYCYRRDAAGEHLAALLYEVTNTFRERHTYVIPAAGTDADGTIRQSCAKALYVSPFIAMGMTYHFRLKPPEANLVLSIRETDEAGDLLFASFTGRRIPLTGRTALATFARFPLLTLKVIGAIHWEALKLWFKGVPLVHHPAPPPHPVSVAVSDTGLQQNRNPELAA